MPQTDLPLAQLRAYARIWPGRPTSTVLGHDAGRTPGTTSPRVRRRSRPGCGRRTFEYLRRLRRVAGPRLAAPPGRAPRPLPAVVEYVGYGGGRGLAHERVLWAAAGYAHLVMDTRGQGSTWSVGETPDPDATGAPAHPGFMTRGILDPATYYYRRVFVDAVRAVEASAGIPPSTRDGSP